MNGRKQQNELKGVFVLIEIILNKICVFYVFVLFRDFLKSSLKTYETV